MMYIKRQLAFLESKESWVISLFVPQNENKVTSLVEFPLFMTFLTNHDVLLYTCENITQDALLSETANCLPLFKSPLKRDELNQENPTKLNT